jgi:hypothetical protein
MNDTNDSISTKRPGRLRTMVIAGGLTAGLLGGGIAGLTLGSTAVSGAQDDTTTTAPAQPPAEGQGRPDPTQRIQDTPSPRRWSPPDPSAVRVTAPAATAPAEAPCARG